MILTVPSGRGKSNRNSKRPWAKTVTSVARNANSGHDWSGDWLVQDTESEVEPGDLIVVGDKDGEGAVLYVAAPVAAWVDGQAGSEDRYLAIMSNDTHQWAAAMSATARQWVAMSTEERLAEARGMRTSYLRSARAKAEASAEYKFAGACGPAAVERIDALLASITTPSDPRAEALAEIRRLMAEHSITAEELADVAVETGGAA